MWSTFDLVVDFSVDLGGCRTSFGHFHPNSLGHHRQFDHPHEPLSYLELLKLSELEWMGHSPITIQVPKCAVERNIDACRRPYSV